MWTSHHGIINIAYFQRITKIRYVTNRILYLRNGNDLITDIVAIENYVVSYFKYIFNTNNNCIDNGLIEIFIPNFLNVSINDMPTNLPSLNDVRDVFSVNSNGARDPNSYGAF